MSPDRSNQVARKPGLPTLGRFEGPRYLARPWHVVELRP